MSILGRLRHQLRYGLMTRSVLLRLEKIGVYCMPYILYRENVEPADEVPEAGYQTSLIEADDLKRIARNFPDADFTAAAWADRLAGGQLGILATSGNEMVGYTWADMRQCGLGPDRQLFELNPHEAYLRYTHVTKKHRGKAVASLLRVRLYQELERRGRTDLFSISEFFNLPAKNFKKKLAAVPAELRLCLRFFHRWGFDICLRRYTRARNPVT